MTESETFLYLTDSEEPCQVKETRPHGRTKYVFERCRCDICVQANRDYANRNNRHRAYGCIQLVDAEPVRAHVAALRSQGMGWHRISAKAGVANSVLSNLIYGRNHRSGPAKRVRPETAAKIMAVELDLGGKAVVDATGARRRLQALVAIGWSQAKLGTRLGVKPTNFSALMKRTRMTASTARAIRALYDELWATPPPQETRHQKHAASLARNYAAARRWVPPLAWDDDTIDDPSSEPVGVRPRTRAERSGAAG